MYNQTTKKFSGYCPVFDGTKEIEIILKGFNSMGAPSNQEPLLDYDCDSQNKCAEQQIHRCPIFMEYRSQQKR